MNANIMRTHIFHIIKYASDQISNHLFLRYIFDLTTNLLKTFQKGQHFIK